MSAEDAATDPVWSPSIAGTRVMKPKFHDLWLDILGKNLTIVTKPTVRGKTCAGELLKGEPSRLLGGDGQPVKKRSKDEGQAMMEIQRLMLVQFQADEAVTYRAELMMEHLTQHIVEESLRRA